MSDILCVTNRALCDERFLTQLERIAAARPAGIILREKDLSPDAYRTLAEQVMQICRLHSVSCILHTFVETAIELGAEAIHLPLPVLRGMTAEQKSHFAVLGASCHSVSDVKEAQRLGCTYVTAGHVFKTDCKKGLPGRGLEFLRSACRSVSIPVYAIGGIASDNINQVRAAGAAGACVMSGLMRCADVQKYMKAFEKAKGE